MYICSISVQTWFYVRQKSEFGCIIEKVIKSDVVAGKSVFLIRQSKKEESYVSMFA